MPMEGVFWHGPSLQPVSEVSFFANSMLLETQGIMRNATRSALQYGLCSCQLSALPAGILREVEINTLINEGVQIYMSRTIPVILLFLVSAGGYVFVTAGWGTLTCFCAGALLNLLSAWVGVRTTVQGTSRLATLLGENLSRSVQLGMWTGSIGGLLSTSLALGGTSSSLAGYESSQS